MNCPSSLHLELWDAPCQSMQQLLHVILRRSVQWVGEGETQYFPPVRVEKMMPHRDGCETARHCTNRARTTSSPWNGNYDQQKPAQMKLEDHCRRWFVGHPVKIGMNATLRCVQEGCELDASSEWRW